MKTKTHLADEKKYNSLAWKIVKELDYHSYEVLDYGGCYYESDRPSLDEDKMYELIQKVLDANNISNC